MRKKFIPTIFFLLFFLLLLFFQIALAASSSITVTQNVISEDATVFPLPKEEIPPLIFNLNTSFDLKGTSVVISWETDSPSITDLKYGRERNSYNLGGVFNFDLKQKHKIVLTGLKKGETYYFQIKTRGENEREAVSKEQRFVAYPFYSYLIKTIIKK